MKYHDYDKAGFNHNPPCAVKRAGIVDGMYSTAQTSGQSKTISGAILACSLSNAIAGHLPVARLFG
jgi:hypothetical protein